MFKVNGQTWHIKRTTPYSYKLVRSDGGLTIGVADNIDKTIYVSELLYGKFLDKVICHELCHVFSFENNLSIPIETEEIIADFMSIYGRSIIYLADDLMRNIFMRVA